MARNFHYIFLYYQKGSCWNIIPILIVCALGVAWQGACSLWFLARMLTQQLVSFLWKRKNSIKGMAFRCVKNKKDLGAQGSHSPAVRPTGSLWTGCFKIWHQTVPHEWSLCWCKKWLEGVRSCCRWRPQSLNLMDSIPLIPLGNMCWGGISKINAWEVPRELQ